MFPAAKVLSTTHTVMHWHGTAVNPDDGVTYVYRVGSPPAEPRRRLEAVPDLSKAS